MAIEELSRAKWLEDQLYKAYLDARKGKRRTSDEQRFEMVMFEGIQMLAQTILLREYQPRQGIAFIVRDPVVREIFAAPFVDRVVHHFLYNMVAEWWDRRFINDSYSCRKGKGTLYAAQRLQKNILRATRDGTREATGITMDIKGYFMSLDRKRLLERIDWGLERQYGDDPWLKHTLHYLWKETIMDDPTGHVELRGDLSAWRDLPASKSLFCQPPGKGIVIGNLSSQLLSNIYLDTFDRYVTLELGYKFYGRYVDDFYIVVEDERREQVLDEIELMRRKLQSMGLTLHPKKTHVQDVRKGIKFVGVMVYKNKIIPGFRMKNNTKKAIHEYLVGRGSAESVQAYLGVIEHFEAGEWMRRTLKGMGVEELRLR